MDTNLYTQVNMPINIRNELIEQHIAKVQKQMMKDMDLDKLSKPQVIDELAHFYDRERKERHQI